MVLSPESIRESVLEFNDPTYSNLLQKSALGGNPLYFLCIRVDGKPVFALSKFCYSPGELLIYYIGGTRGTIGGGPAEIAILKVLGKKWIPFMDADEEMRLAFVAWISRVQPKYFPERASLVFVEVSTGGQRHKMRKITQDELDEVLAQRKLAGDIGERIAMDFERERLRELGCKNPDDYIELVSLLDAGAGYDILSNFKEERLIEVKASRGSMEELSFS